MVGIYELISPSGKVYVGQSWDIIRRFRVYKNLKCQKQPKLYNSLVKYGWENHRVHIFELFYGDKISQDELDRSEINAIRYHKDQGKEVLNLASGGGRGKHSEESLEKLRSRRGELHPSFGKKRSKEWCDARRGSRNPNYGNRGPKNPNFGKKQSEERRLKTSGKNQWMYGKTGEQCQFFGKKQSPEHVAKRSGKNHKKSKAVINIITGEIYDTIGQAAKIAGITYSALQWTLKSKKVNNTNFRYYDNNIDIKNGKVVLDE